ncbi:MAG: hypothetical protein Q7U60_08215 [Candidatus Methanoperedens sp.]|nr:hypothetical protein [Candidatus Methanoperedens sp.]
MFRKFLESYIDVCNNIVTEAANSVLMFEAGEQAAMDIKTIRIEDIQKEFENEGILISVEISEKKATFHVKGLPLCGKKCIFCNMLRGFLGGLQENTLIHVITAKKAQNVLLRGQTNVLSWRSWLNEYKLFTWFRWKQKYQIFNRVFILKE